MLTAIATSILGAIVPALPNWLKDLAKAKQEKADRDFELEKIKLTNASAENVQAAQSQAIALKAQAEADARVAEATAKMAEINAARGALKTGIKWIDAGDAVMRLFLGTIASAALIWAMLQAWKMAMPIWEQGEIWEIIKLIIYFFVGYLPSAYSMQKVYSKK